MFVNGQANSLNDDNLHPLIVNTTYGPIRGAYNNGARMFRGIPYAAPPIGDLRWQPPSPHEGWTDVYNATSFQPGCPQICNVSKFVCPQNKSQMSESCLYMNIWTPQTQISQSQSEEGDNDNNNNNDESELLPVMAWIHGGNFKCEWINGILYDGSNLANATNIVIVSFQYRLGVLGFYYDTRYNIYGNYGMMDQVFALQWIHDNIKNFGGNPNNVTIFGQSAGGESISLHLLNTSSNLFHRAILQSAPLGLPLRSVENWIPWNKYFIEQSPCSNDSNSNEIKSCLNQLSWQQVLLSQVRTEGVTSLLTPGNRYL